LLKIDIANILQLYLLLNTVLGLLGFVNVQPVINFRKYQKSTL